MTTEGKTKETRETKETKATAKAKAKVEPKKTAKDEIVEAIKKLTVLELADLVKTLEEELGVSAAAPMAVATTPAAAGAPAESGAAAPVEEQTEFTVLLKEIGANKVNVIKAVREMTTLGLKESKELVESAPTAVKEGIPKDEAAQVKEKLEAAGAVVEVK